MYGAVTQYANPEDDSAPLPPKDITVVSKIVGTFLYYDLAVDSTMLVDKTYNSVVWLLNYAAIHPPDVASIDDNYWVVTLIFKNMVIYPSV